MLTKEERAVDRLLPETLKDIERMIAESLSREGEEISLPLVRPSFGVSEILEAIDSLLTTYLTMGRKVHRFEAAFADYLGVKHAIMVNSGSSANLIAMHIISNPALQEHLAPRSEVIVPATSWSTSVFPILDIGCLPVFVDSDARTFNMDIDQVRTAISDKTRAILAVHLMGNPCALDELKEIADENNLFLIEDSCEAHGAEYAGRKTGTWGDIGTFSFFFSHHISTIEGGMVVTDNDSYAEIARCLRAHGWIRELDRRKEIAACHPDIDNRFLFYNRGFNLRPTEIQGAFGIHQISKLESIVDARRKNAEFWINGLRHLENHIEFQHEQDNGRHVWFGFPLILKEGPTVRKRFSDYLESKRISTRPIMAGNMAKQPAMRLFPHRTVGTLTVSERLHRQGIFIGNHHALTGKERAYLVDEMNAFFKKA